MRQIDITFEKSDGIEGYQKAVDCICHDISEALRQKAKICVLSDRAMGQSRVPLSALVAVGAAHHHLLRLKSRSKMALIVETGGAREIQCVKCPSHLNHI